jgi:hypothetical protein
VSPAKRVQLLAAVSVSVALSCAAWLQAEKLSWVFAFEQPKASQEPAFFETILDYKVPSGVAHAVSASLFDERFDLHWFEGTRESHEDVVIKRAQFALDAGQSWAPGPVGTFLSRHDMAKLSKPHQAIWSLGNTIQLRPGSTSQLTTIVSVGGWAAAAIAKVDIEQNTVKQVRKLRLSPMFNRSHLVRNEVVEYEDGTLAIPAYFELGNSFGVFVRLDKEYEVYDKSRMSQRRVAIQPDVVVTGPQSAVALMRNFDKDTNQLVATWTEDGGQSWSPAEFLDLPNPNAPVAAVLTSRNGILMAYNDHPHHGHTLSLGLSRDQGRTWTAIAQLENGEGNVRYPEIRRLRNGQYMLAYSVGSKTGIRAHVFNEAWIEEQYGR